MQTRCLSLSEKCARNAVTVCCAKKYACIPRSLIHFVNLYSQLLVVHIYNSSAYAKNFPTARIMSHHRIRGALRESNQYVQQKIRALLRSLAVPLSAFFLGIEKKV